MKRMLLVALGATLLLLGAFGIASAHAELDHCTPAVGSTVASAPTQIVCVFSEEIDTKRSTMSVWNAAGKQVDKKDAHVDLNDANHETLVVSLDTSQAPNGLYTIQWRTVTPDDNGLSYGSWQFVIGSSSQAPYSPTQVLDGEVNAQGTPLATSTPAANATPSNLGIMIASPTDGATVPAGDVKVEIMPKNVTLGPQYHWHLYVDGAMTDMVMNGGTTDVAHLAPGTHEIKVTLADSTHNELASDTIHVTAVASTSTTATPAATALPAATPTPAMPMTPPTTGGAPSNAWMLLALLGAMLLLGGTALAVRR